MFSLFCQKNLFVTKWRMKEPVLYQKSLKNNSQRTSSVKDLIVNISGFASHMVSVVTTQLCHYSLRAATDDM